MCISLRPNPSFPSLPVDTGFPIEERKVKMKLLNHIGGGQGLEWVRLIPALSMDAVMFLL